MGQESLSRTVLVIRTLTLTLTLTRVQPIVYLTDLLWDSTLRIFLTLTLAQILVLTGTLTLALLPTLTRRSLKQDADVFALPLKPTTS